MNNKQESGKRIIRKLVNCYSDMVMSAEDFGNNAHYNTAMQQVQEAVKEMKEALLYNPPNN